MIEHTYVRANAGHVRNFYKFHIKAVDQSPDYHRVCFHLNLSNVTRPGFVASKTGVTPK
jgi:hypothetical protein